MIEQFLPQDWEQSDQHKRVYEHSKTVANAAKIIASNTTKLDANKAYVFGIMHDIGKFYLTQDKKYKHPRMGYDLLKDRYPEIAVICLTHPFPDFTSYEHILHYSHDDEDEAQKVFGLLSHIEKNIYIELIQFCDKISRVSDYITWEEKLDWYLKTYDLDPDELVNQYSTHLLRIKQKLDNMTHTDVYKLLI